MAEPAQQTAVYSDLWDLPENITGEILYGQIHTQPRPAPKHALASSSLGDELVGPFQKGRHGGPGGWWILDEPELHLEADLMVPDLAGWRKSRMPELPETAWFEYAQHGVGYVWLIDPVVRTLEAYELVDGRWVLLGTFREDQCVAIAPFEAVELPIGALWG